jgi:para-nitrobenzyl esterase
VLFFGTSAYIDVLVRGERRLPVEVEVEVECGKLRGITDHEVRVFRGVPYASPPIGDRRFAPPSAVQPWTGVRDATEFAEPSLQSAFDIVNDNPMINDSRTVGSEDCLYLNIYAPSSHGNYPVLVWIHGGGGMMGSGNNIDGIRFALHGVVVVTIAYRLGALGLLYLPGVFDEVADANFAVLDQIEALQWVRRNIAAFGGDPDRITLGGQSHGARSVGNIIAAPGAEGLFNQAIMMSGTGVGHLISDEEEAERVTSAVLGELQLKSSDSSRLRKIPAHEIVAAQTRMATRWPTILPFQAVMGGSIIPERPIDAIKHGVAGRIRIMIGTTHDEFESFSLGNGGLGTFKSMMVDTETIRTATDHYRRLLPDDWTDSEVSRIALTSSDWWIPAIRVAEAHAAAGGSCWMYRFDWRLRPRGQGFGAPHGLDLAFITLPEPLASDFSPNSEEAPRFSLVIDIMRRSMITFISNEEPTAFNWPAYDPPIRSTFIFDNISYVDSDPDKQLRLVWQDLM